MTANGYDGTDNNLGKVVLYWESMVNHGGYTTERHRGSAASKVLINGCDEPTL